MYVNPLLTRISQINWRKIDSMSNAKQHKEMKWSGKGLKVGKAWINDSSAWWTARPQSKRFSSDAFLSPVSQDIDFQPRPRLIFGACCLCVNEFRRLFPAGRLAGHVIKSGELWSPSRRRVHACANVLFPQFFLFFSFCPANRAPR